MPRPEQPAPSWVGTGELQECCERAVRWSQLHYQPLLARALDQVLHDPQHLPVPSGRPDSTAAARHGGPAPQAACSEAARSFVGALARLPQPRAAELAAMLEVWTFARVAFAVLTPRTGPEPRLHPLELAQQARARQLAAEDPVALRARLASLLYQRLTAGGLATVRQRGTEGLVQGLLAALARGHGMRATLVDKGVLPRVLEACLRAMPQRGDGTAVPGVGRLLGTAALHGAVAGAGLAVAYAHRDRVSLTATAVLYVLLSGLFGLNLPFGAYEWVARSLAALLELPVLAASAVAWTARVMLRQQRRFDLALLGYVTCAVYRLC